MKTMLAVEVDEKIKDAVKQLAKEYDCDMRDVVQKAVVELLKKNGKDVSLPEIKIS